MDIHTPPKNLIARLCSTLFNALAAHKTTTIACARKNGNDRTLFYPYPTHSQHAYKLMCLNMHTNVGTYIALNQNPQKPAWGVVVSLVFRPCGPPYIYLYALSEYTHVGVGVVCILDIWISSEKGRHLTLVSAGLKSMQCKKAGLRCVFFFIKKGGEGSVTELHRANVAVFVGGLLGNHDINRGILHIE